MLEKKIENYLKRQVELIGGLCLKFTSPSFAGVPDRIVLFNGLTFFVEVKAPGKKPTPRQMVVHKLFASKGHKVYIIDSREAVDNFIKNVLSKYDL